MNAVNMNYEKRLPRTLFALIVLTLFPFIISYSILDNKSLLIPLLASGYTIGVVVFSSTFLNFNTRIHFSSVFIAIGIILLQFFTLGIDLILGISINYKDFFNGFAKALNFLLLFGLMLNIRVKKTQIIMFMKYLVVFAFIACIYNVFANWRDIWHISNISSSYQLNLKSFFVNRNQFGAFLFISIAAHFYLLLGKRIHKANIFIFILQITNVILTMSRGAILACVVFFAVYFLQQVKNMRIFLSVIALCSIIAIIVLSNSEISSFVVKDILRVQFGVTGRSEIWQMGLNVALQNNIVNGVGFFTGLELAQAQGFQFDEFHSLFIDGLVSGGIIELSLIILLLNYVFRRFIKKCTHKGYRIVFIASTCAMWALSLFESLSFFSIGYVDTIITIFFVSIPLLISNMDELKGETYS